MFKQLLRTNQAFSVPREAPVNPYPVRRKNSEDPRKSLADTFGYIFRQTRMDIDRRMKELADLFTKTRNELSELVRKNEQFVMDEMRRVEEAVRTATEVVCTKGKMDRLRGVKDDYAERIKICNEKAAAGFRAAKATCDQRLPEIDALRDSMRQILKDCLQTNEFVKCVAGGTKEAVKQRGQITKELNETVKNAETSVRKQLLEATKCHANAQAKALESLHKILKDTKDCVE
ncbi:unnamed protein product [Xylocopa violacea]|uniref:Protein TsetseEP domain-containing protein n=1 Tax=Xylocopa violacea TaxID=135666 RepID=A0ABP1PHR5_XYLVO